MQLVSAILRHHHIRAINSRDTSIAQVRACLFDGRNGRREPVFRYHSHCIGSVSALLRYTLTSCNPTRRTLHPSCLSAVFSQSRQLARHRHFGYRRHYTYVPCSPLHQPSGVECLLPDYITARPSVVSSLFSS